MRWEGGRRSTNIEDRRGMSAGTIGGGGIGMLLLVLAVSCITGTNPLALLQIVEQAQPEQQVLQALPDLLVSMELPAQQELQEQQV